MELMLEERKQPRQTIAQLVTILLLPMKNLSDAIFPATRNTGPLKPL